MFLYEALTCIFLTVNLLIQEVSLVRLIAKIRWFPYILNISDYNKILRTYFKIITRGKNNRD